MFACPTIAGLVRHNARIAQLDLSLEAGLACLQISPHALRSLTSFPYVPGPNLWMWRRNRSALCQLFCQQLDEWHSSELDIGQLALPHRDHQLLTPTKTRQTSGSFLLTGVVVGFSAPRLPPLLWTILPLIPGKWLWLRFSTRTCGLSGVQFYQDCWISLVILNL